MEDVTPRELLDDAARIGNWIRELRALEYEESLLAERFIEEQGPLGDGDRGLRDIAVVKRLRDERPERGERIRFLRREIEAALTRGRLVEMAAIAEKWLAV